MTAQSQQIKTIRERAFRDFLYYASHALFIRSESGSIDPFVLNQAQNIIHAKAEDQKERTGKIRTIVLKARQMGCSTYVEGRFYWRVTHRCGVRAFILTHEAEATDNLFEMAQRYHQNCPELFRPHLGASSAKELYFDILDSGYKVGTAGNKGVGRSSTIQLFHGSEVAFWPHPEEHAKGIMQAVPRVPETEMFLESTANGEGNYFHHMWQEAERGIGEFEPIFIPWYVITKYREPAPKGFECDDYERELKAIYKLQDDQLYWRRLKIAEFAGLSGDGELSFKQEYPSNAAEAFQSTGLNPLIPSSFVVRAMDMEQTLERVGSKIVGVDPARFGDDRTAIIRRQGRVGYNLETYQKYDTMQIVGLVVNILRNEQPDAVFVDVTGLGAGVYDRLKELGYSGVVKAVNFGETAWLKDRFVNRRAEIWCNMLDWLKDTPCQLPKSSELMADITAPQYTVDSRGRIQLEKKEDMKKRGLRSPDGGDAFALTFAEPVMQAANANTIGKMTQTVPTYI
jgi:hypothetical protein